MLTEAGIGRVYLAYDLTDLRKSIDGLAALSKKPLNLPPLSTSSFFVTGSAIRLKILYWDHNGFCLYYRQLERGRFQWPMDTGETTQLISRRELSWLLDSLSLNQPKAHSEVRAHFVL